MLGDGILAYFVFNKHDEYNADPLDAIDAALELRKSFDRIKKRWIEICRMNFGHQNISIDLKCGINHGKVLFGLLDTVTQCQVTVLGSDVNLASRLEKIARNEQIIVSKKVKKIVEKNNCKNNKKFLMNKIPLKREIKSFPEIREIYEIIGKQ